MFVGFSGGKGKRCFTHAAVQDGRGDKSFMMERYVRFQRATAIGLSFSGVAGFTSPHLAARWSDTRSGVRDSISSTDLRTRKFYYSSIVRKPSYYTMSFPSTRRVVLCKHVKKKAAALRAALSYAVACCCRFIFFGLKCQTCP